MVLPPKGKPLTPNQLRQYLHKLQLTELDPLPNLDTLQQVHYAHLKMIPYDNFDCLNGKITSINRAEVFRKIILHNRGGICFELNQLYNWLLESIGFDVVSYSARFIDKLDPFQIRRHRIMCVTLGEDRYFTDVGVDSESPRRPLLLVEDLEQEDGISQYKFTKEEFFGWVLWQKEKRKPWKRLLGFTEEPQMDKDFLMATFYCDAHPDSPFNKRKLLSIFRDDCNITIRGNFLKFYLGGRVKYRYVIQNGEELKAILWEHFGINVEYTLRDEGMDY